MRKIAVILYGPPGSGKGTQANLLASKTSLMHFDTGHFLEAVVHDPKRNRERSVAHERDLFDSGKLMTPSFVLREILKETRRISKAGWGLVFSGSPRTVFEAQGLLPELKKLYGAKDVFIFVLKVPDSASLRRNSARLICSVCGQGLLSAYYPKTKTPPKHCPVCGGTFYKRTLDKPEVIRVRLKEYRERTLPVLTLARNMGFRVVELDGTPAPYKVFGHIHAIVKKAIRH